MRNSAWYLAVLVVLAGALAMGTGCKSRKGGGLKGAGDDTVRPEDYQGGAGDQAGLPPHTPGTIFDPGRQFQNVLFDYDSAQINDAERGKIDAVADFLRQNAGVSAILEGFCDERGSAEYNVALGEKRSLAVRAYLIGCGLDGAVLQTKSMGEESPVDPGHNEAAWLQNRRVEFKFMK